MKFLTFRAQGRNLDLVSRVFPLRRGPFWWTAPESEKITIFAKFSILVKFLIVSEIMHFAEVGVVMMLFLIGLELQPSRLWTLRHSIVGVGGLQVLLSTAAIFSVAYFALQLAWQTSLTVGLMLALSSTAIVIQSLEEKGWLRLDAGQNSFSVLLFQDIAVIPILALLPLLSFMPESAIESEHSLISSWSAWEKVAVSVAAIAGIIVAGKYVSAPIFRYIA